MFKLGIIGHVLAGGHGCGRPELLELLPGETQMGFLCSSHTWSPRASTGPVGRVQGWQGSGIGTVCGPPTASIQLSDAHSALSLVVLWGTAAVVQLFLGTTKYVDTGHGTVFLWVKTLKPTILSSRAENLRSDEAKDQDEDL